MRPGVLDRPKRDAELLRDLGRRQPGEEPERDHLGAARIDDFETGQRGLERQEVFDRYGAGGRRLQQIVEDEILRAATALLAFLMAAVIDQQPAHRLRGQRQAMRSSLPLRPMLVLQPEPGLVDERRRLKRVIPPLAPEIPPRDATQLAVDDWKDLRCRRRTLRRHAQCRSRWYSTCASLSAGRSASASFHISRKSR